MKCHCHVTQCDTMWWKQWLKQLLNTFVEDMFFSFGLIVPIWSGWQRMAQSLQADMQVCSTIFHATTASRWEDLFVPRTRPGSRFIVTNWTITWKGLWTNSASTDTKICYPRQAHQLCSFQTYWSQNSINFLFLALSSPFMAHFFPFIFVDLQVIETFTSSRRYRAQRSQCCEQAQRKTYSWVRCSPFCCSVADNLQPWGQASQLKTPILAHSGSTWAVGDGILFFFFLPCEEAARSAKVALPPLEDAASAKIALPPLEDAAPAKVALPPLEDAAPAKVALPPLEDAAPAKVALPPLEDAASSPKIFLIIPDESTVWRIDFFRAWPWPGRGRGRMAGWPVHWSWPDGRAVAGWPGGRVGRRVSVAGGRWPWPDGRVAVAVSWPWPDGRHGPGWPSYERAGWFIVVKTFYTWRRSVVWMFSSSMWQSNNLL